MPRSVPGGFGVKKLSESFDLGMGKEPSHSDRADECQHQREAGELEEESE